MTFTAVDCQSFAGGFSLGVVQAGFKLIGKREHTGGFGVPVMEANRHLLGDDWQAEACPAADWTPLPADLVFGNPPCSGFSHMNAIKTQEHRDEINACMHDLVNYAAKCDPKIVIFESVQGAFRQGRDLMLELRDELEVGTGHDYDLFHVLHNVSDLGGAQIRKRYFWVASRIPFGVMPQFQDNPVTIRDRIGDLEKQGPEVPGHVTHGSPRSEKLARLAETGVWAPGERSGEAWLRRPDIPVDSQDRRTMSGFASIRMEYDKPSRVLVGDSLGKHVHPVLPRTMTYREAARLTGFPDEWDVTPYTQTVARSKWFGKGITVEAGRWIASAAYDALNGQEAPYWGIPIGDREYLIDATDPEAYYNQDLTFF